MKFPVEKQFKLPDGFIENYRNKKPDFGFNGLGEFVYMRTYSRTKEDGKNEQWFETVRRVVEGVFSIQKQHIEDYMLGWNQGKAQKSSQEMYDRIFNFKMLPAGRSLWAMGADVVMKKGLTEALYNCCFLSTKNIADNPGLIFANAMDFLMCGIGVGADTLGENTIKIKQPNVKEHVFVIPDDREGWVESLKLLINSFFGGNTVSFDYSLIRPSGVPIKSFGGISAGYEPLKEMHDSIRNILETNIGNYISVRNITDIFNLIGKAVISGNVRRSAEVILGNPTEEFLNLKDYAVNPDRESFGWSSNNSIFAEVGMNYKEAADRTARTAEPGYIWLDNVKKYGRVREDDAEYKDSRVAGANPCLEIGLEHSELCNLVELFPTKHSSLEDFKTTIKYAYLYAKSITLLSTHWQDSNRVMLRNRRIGLGITGITQFIANNGINTLKKWMEEGYTAAKSYDKIYSEWFAVPESIKITTVKPSGTLSLLVGVTPGIHFPQSKYYIRRVRLSKNSPFVDVLRESGYKIEPAFGQEDNTVVTEFIVGLDDKIRTQANVTMWEQLNLTSFVQKYWSDNAVSVTVTFKKEEEKDIEHALDLFQYSLKGVSFLPLLEEGAYRQMPYEEITKEKYEELLSTIKPIEFSKMFSTDASLEKYCTNDTCII